MAIRKIIFYNQKGGVGKTTVTVDLGSALAQMGKKVLLIDFDAQVNLTHSISGNERKPNIYQVVTNQVDVEDAIQKTQFDNLFLIPGSLDLAGLAIELCNVDNREGFLKRALEPIEDDYDYIFVDCPPSLGLETVNALAWCSDIIIPLQCEYLAMEGLKLIMRTVSNAKKSFNKEINIFGIVFTMYSGRAKLCREVVDDIKSYFPSLAFNTIIPRTTRLAEAPSFGLPIGYYDKSSKGARAFQALAEEVISRG